MKENNFYKKLFAIVLPIACQNLISAMVSASDAIMLGTLNQESLSAVSLATQVQFVLSLFFSALMIGETILAAQYWGKGNTDTVEYILALVTKISFGIAVVFFAGAYFAPSLLMKIFTNDIVLIKHGSSYLRIVSWSYLLASISQIYLCIMKNSGRTLRSTIYSMVSMILNIFLNAVFIFGLFGFEKRGIEGAAIATVIARLVEVILVLGENQRKKVVRLKLSNLRYADSQIKKDFWKYTSPVLANELVWGCGFSMFSVIMGHLGSDALAANSYANIVSNLISCFCLGIGAGSSIIIGNELGSGRLETAKEEGGKLCRIAIVSGILSGGIILLLSPLILNQVGNLTIEAQDYLKGMLYICAFFIIGKAINSTTISGIFCAGGDTKFGFICDTITMWGIIIPIGMLAAFVFHFPVIVVYFILNFNEFIKIPAVYVHYKKYKWVQNLTR